MKKTTYLFTALTLVIFSACSNDDSSDSSSDDLVLPKTIFYNYPDFPQDNNKNLITYDGNKILTSIDDDSKSVFTYEGNVIVKQTQFNLDNSENKQREVSYAYENGRLKIKILKEGFSTEYPNGQYIYKTVYTHVSDNLVSYIYYYIDPITKNETKRSEGTLNYKDGNLVKEESVTNDNTVTQNYEYDNKNNPFKNILGFTLLLNEVNFGINNK